MMTNKVALLSARDMRRSILAGFINAASVVCGIIPFFYIVTMLDLLAQKQPLAAILPQCGIIALLLVAKAVFYGLGLAVTHRLAFSTLADIRGRLIDHMERLSLAGMEKRKSGELAHIVNHEVEQVELFLAHALPELLIASIIPVAIIGFMYTVFQPFAFIYAVQIPLLVLYTMWYMKDYAPKFDEYYQRTSRMSSDLMEYIAGIRVIKVCNTGKGKTRQLLEQMRDYIVWVKRVTRLIILPRFVQSFIIACGMFLIAVVGTEYLLDNVIQFKTFVIGIIFAGFFGESLSKLLVYTFRVMKFNASRKAILSVLTIPPRTWQETEVPVTGGDIQFSAVSFTYEDKSVLENISFTVRKNTMAALVGISGSGKTTIGKLINGFLLPDAGTVTINGIATTALPEAAIARLVSYVQQDAFLFNTSVYENILIGNPDATEKEVYKAARQAQIHNFIQSLPDGYNTQVGEGGSRLSGGERQRIALARMILKDAPIIILDEATSSLDSQNEQAVEEAIAAAGAGKTRIVITHRLDTVSHADKIIVVDKGCIIDQGLHGELLTRCRHYNQMVAARYAADHWTVREKQPC
ncbi:MAG TPA: ABC transporter ATP-binding protein [Methylomusa anaerophila]|uniref:Putative multidrug export ATP-binding/permease protein n=1 Tax=Methylomusa anaerophila TaxID=1930071 RepID=A0A348AEF0_9FIRM|nr:ABC transporter ATP-binding protein [Methylomusa anaerophila]BBB89448.1 putative multidrug export ATP-binding/permease protein [Methylomusa anaerophila]HML89681.1 ABC transporter ATP-binding protein [Methylomusa anaerophila]